MATVKNISGWTIHVVSNTGDSFVILPLDVEIELGDEYARHLLILQEDGYVTIEGTLNLPPPPPIASSDRNSFQLEYYVNVMDITGNSVRTPFPFPDVLNPRQHGILSINGVSFPLVVKNIPTNLVGNIRDIEGYIVIDYPLLFHPEVYDRIVLYIFLI